MTMRDALAVAAGLTLLVAGMLGTFILIALSGWIAPLVEGEPVDLTPWLWVELIAGAALATVGGVVCAAISPRRRAVFILTGLILALGLAEAGAIASGAESAAAGVEIIAPLWLTILAPLVAAADALGGGMAVLMGRARAIRLP